MTILKPYPTYRKTDLPWLGQIPAHWEVRRLKSTIEYCQNGAWGDEPNGIDDVACVRVADFDRTKFRVKFPVPTMRALPKEERKNKSLRKGDLLLEKSGGGELQPVGFVVLYDSEEPAICSNFVARMPVQENHDPNFLCYLHASLYAGKINTQSIKQNTGIQNLDATAYLNEKVALPSLPEQQAIAVYLDHQTAKIDALIAKKERLLDLLSEQRAAIISQAVTKGLNPDVKMKDSGVAWLGQVPSHWRVKRLKHISPSQSVGLVINPSNYVSDEGVPFLYGGDISEGHISTEKARRITPENSKLLKQSMLRTGDLVMVRVGYPGITAVVPESLEGSNCASMMIVRRHKSFISDWLCYVMNSRASRAQIEIVQYGAAQEQFNISHAVNFIYPAPPLSEQVQIVNYLDKKTKQLDGLKAKVENVIERLREYRAALISSVVTGKIRVQE